MAGGKWAGRGDPHGGPGAGEAAQHERGSAGAPLAPDQDRKSTRLNSSHSQISYAVFCLKKKKHREMFSPYSERTATSTPSPRPTCAPRLTSARISPHSRSSDTPSCSKTSTSTYPTSPET